MRCGVHRTIPYAMTNTIRVDVGGDGFTVPDADPPKWLCKAALAAAQPELTDEDLEAQCTP